MENLDIWKKVCRPPAGALKTIQGGRLKGMTDIKPQWRYYIMTEVFGPCGIGWWFTIDKLWSEDGADGAKLAFASISLYHGEGSKPTPGIGGSMIVEKERSGLHNSDEGYKMAVTDALSTAMKMLGVAADIYAGKWDGSKYKDANPQPPKGFVPPTEEQKKAMKDMLADAGKVNPGKFLTGKDAKEFKLTELNSDQFAARFDELNKEFAK